MREVMRRSLCILSCVLIIGSIYVRTLPHISESDFSEVEEEIFKDEDMLKPGNPVLRGTRAEVERTVLGEKFPQDYLFYPGYDYITWGWEFELNADCIISLGAFYNDYPYQYFYLDIWEASTRVWLGGSGSMPSAAVKYWTWSSNIPIWLMAGTYILSAFIYTQDGCIGAVENPGLTADGVINPIKTVYCSGYSFPDCDYGTTLLPMVDIRYTYNFTPDITVPDDFATIQEAVNAADPGDSVFVRNNPLPYEEELIINKAIDLIGENDDTTIIDASSVVAGSGYTVHITGDLVNLSGFTIRGGDCGVFLDYSYDCTIYWNSITENNDYGIYMDNANNDTISLNKIFSNNIDGDSEGFGIFTQDSNAKGVWSNWIHNNKVGVKLINSWLWGCLNWNMIYNNDIGVDYDPEPLEIDGNIFINNRIAIKISGDDSPVTISNNTIIGSEFGIYIETGSPLIEGNTFENNTYAIYYLNASAPIIQNNTFRNNIIDIYHFIWAQIDFNPNTLNLKSKGRWITCYLELPGEMDVNEIDISTLKLSKVNDYPVDIPVESHPTGIEDNDGDGILELMIKFDRSEVQDVVGLGGNELTLTGQLTDGSELGGSDSIIVKSPP